MRSSVRRVSISLVCALSLAMGGLTATASPARADTATPLVHRVIGNVGAGDGGPVSQARVRATLVAGNAEGSVVLYEPGLIRVIDGKTQVIRTVAGGGRRYAFPAGGSLATDMNLWGGTRELRSLAISPTGEVSFSYGFGVYTIAADGTLHTHGLGGNALAYTADGTLLLTYENQLMAFAPGEQWWTAVAGGPEATSSAEGVPAKTARLTGLNKVTVDQTTGDIYLSETGRIRRISASDGLINTVAGSSVPQPYPYQQPADGSPAAAPIYPNHLSFANGQLEFLNGYASDSLELIGLRPTGVLHRLRDVTACGFTSFVSRATDVLVACGLRSYARTADGLATQATMLAPTSGRSGDEVPTEQAWADRYDSVARLTDGTLALAQGGDLLLVNGSQVRSHHLEGLYVDEVAADPAGGVTVLGSGLVRHLSADGTGPVTVAGGGEGDPTGPAQQATSAKLTGAKNLVVAPDGTCFLVLGSHLYGVTPAGALTHVGGFTAADADAVGQTAIDPRDGSLVVHGAQGVYRRSATDGSFTRIAQGQGSSAFAVAGDGSLLFGGTYAGSILRLWPDGGSAWLAGMGQPEPGADGVDPRKTEISTTAFAIDNDGDLLVVDNHRSQSWPGLAEIRKVDTRVRDRLDPPTGGTVNGDGAILTIDLPAPPADASWGVQVRADGTVPLDAYDSDLEVLDTHPDGSVHLALRKLAGQRLVVGRTYHVRFSLYRVPEGNSPGTVLSVTLQPDVTPPAAPTRFTVSPVGDFTDYSYVAPADVDLDRIEVRFAPGSTPPAGPTDGNFGGTSPYSGGGYRRGSLSVGRHQPYAFSVFAVDLQGNFSRTTGLLAMPVVVDRPTTAFFLFAGRLADGPPVISLAGVNHPSARYALGTVGPATPDGGTALIGDSMFRQPDLPVGTRYTVSVFTEVPDTPTQVIRISRTFVAGSSFLAVQPLTGLTVHSGTNKATLTWNRGTDPAAPLTEVNITPVNGPALNPAYLRGVSSYTTPTLTAGKDYTVTLRNSYGGDLYATPWQTVTLRATRLVYSAPTTVPSGQAATVKVTLLRGSTPVVGRTVSLQVGAVGSTIRTITAVTGAGGVATFRVTPVVSTSFLATFAGAGTDLGSVSAPFTSTVTSTATLTASSASGRIGRAVTLTATVRLARNPKPSIALQQLVGKTWTTIGYAYANPKGLTTFVVRPGTRGTVQYRVVVPSDLPYASGGTSRAVVVTSG